MRTAGMSWTGTLQKTPRGTVWLGLAAAALGMLATPAAAQELSEKAVKSFMDYAWALTPGKFTRPDGRVVEIDKKKKAEIVPPLDVAREVIRVGRVSAHAQICDLQEEQVSNYRSLMLREQNKKTWTEQQLIYLSQLHLTTVMLLNGKLRLIEKEGDKEVVVDEKEPTAQTCSSEQREKVRTLISTYVKSGPDLAKAPPPPVAPIATPASAKK